MYSNLKKDTDKRQSSIRAICEALADALNASNLKGLDLDELSSSLRKLYTKARELNITESYWLVIDTYNFWSELKIADGSGHWKPLSSTDLTQKIKWIDEGISNIKRAGCSF